MRHAAKRVFAIGVRPAQTTDERAATLGLGRFGRLIAAGDDLIFRRAGGTALRFLGSNAGRRRALRPTGAGGGVLCHVGQADDHRQGESVEEWFHGKSSGMYEEYLRCDVRKKTKAGQWQLPGGGMQLRP